MGNRRIAVIAFAAVLGLAAGALLAARPAGGTEDQKQLAAKAALYYKASKVFDFRTMAGLYTPARQLDEAKDLRDLAARRAKEFAAFQADTRNELQDAAKSITADSIKLDVDGDWAISNGTYTMKVSGTSVDVPLEQLVWLRSAGKWWIYQMKNSELAAYGNPPDKMRAILSKPQAHQGATIAAQPAPPAAAKPADRGSPTKPLLAPGAH